jgi:hypothetical protein
MTTINQLSAVDSVVSSDQVPIYSSGQGDARKASMSVIKSFVLSGATTSDDKVTQYAAPTATGFSVTILDSSGTSVWLILTPLAGYAAGTLVLPAVANCVDRQEILFNTTQAVTTLTINANGATVIGAPTTLAANAFFRLRFDDVLNTWYRVG